jgi:predicted DNA-binding transcriptional regulator AlpA
MQMLNTKEAAALMAVSPATLRNWRCSRQGPPFVRITRRCVKYDEREIQRYLAERRFTPYVCATEVNRHAALQTETQ